jgi:SHS2 domain-containing protein
MVVRGKDLLDLFALAGWSFFDLMIQARRIEKIKERWIKIEAPDREALLIAWLGELLYLFESRGLVFSEFNFRTLTDQKLKVKARGELFDPRKHGVKQVIKAVTYHQLRIWEERGVWKARVIFDL